MDEKQRLNFAASLKEWARLHPRANDPAIALGDVELSPVQMAEAVATNNQNGQLLCLLIDQAAKTSGESVETIISQFTTPA